MSNYSSIGSSFGGYYSPDRSRDVDRFNPSTRGNYTPSTSNPYNQPSWMYSSTQKSSGGWYDGAGRYHAG